MSEAPIARSPMGDLPHPARHAHPFDSPLIPNGCQTQSLTSNFEPPPQDSYVATLLVRHIPEAIPHDVLSRLFFHYGASSLRPCSGGRLRNCAFIDFKDEISASNAQSQLNRLRFLGKVLSVERVGKKGPDSHHHRSEGCDTGYAVKGLGLDASMSGNLAKESVGSTYLMSEAIAPKLGVDYPFPSHLEYSYPPPDGNILTNIVNALIAVPRFYTQVLHLMNKMNIPAPFRVALPTPPLPTAVTFQPPPPSSSPPPLPNLPSPRLEDRSSDESELESPEEGDAHESAYLGKNYASRKRRRKQSIVGPAVDKGVAHEAVGLKPAALVPKEVPMIKKKSSVLQIKIAPKLLQCESPPKSYMNVKNVPTCDESEERPFATTVEIEAGKLPAEEILSLPMFKNFIPGNPTPVLYIKNLAKTVVHEDFYFIFGSIFGNIEVTKRSLDIKLMQEGRMKGQAFVTFPSIDLANKALNLVNGYVYKGKPMIIQFGRNSAPVMKAN